ncbi:MAG: cytochrome b/b6 domain-containing protein [Dehalococcoidales bacterium]
MSRTKWLVSIALLAVFAGGILLSSFPDTLLLSKLPWLLIVSAVAGILLGLLRKRFTCKAIIENGKVQRHEIGSFIEHWLTVVGIFLLIISGFIIGFLFFPHFTDTLKSILFPLNMHFIGLNITLLGGFYFLTDYIFSCKLSSLIPNFKDLSEGTIGKYLFKKECCNEGKYLSSQKAAFLVYAILGGVQIITGFIKIMGHFWGISHTALAVTTLIHDIFSLLFVIMVIVHVLFVVLSTKHRTLLKSWFTGNVSESYAKEEHKVWYDQFTK